MTSSGFLRAVRRGHRPAPQLLVGGGAAQTAGDEPLQADRLTAIGHHDTMGTLAVFAVRFGEAGGCQNRPDLQPEWTAAWRLEAMLSTGHDDTLLGRETCSFDESDDAVGNPALEVATQK